MFKMFTFAFCLILVLFSTINCNKSLLKLGKKQNVGSSRPVCPPRPDAPICIENNNCCQLPNGQWLKCKVISVNPVTLEKVLKCV